MARPVGDRANAGRHGKDMKRCMGWQHQGVNGDTSFW